MIRRPISGSPIGAIRAIAEKQSFRSDTYQTKRISLAKATDGYLNVEINDFEFWEIVGFRATGYGDGSVGSSLFLYVFEQGVNLPAAPAINPVNQPEKLIYEQYIGYFDALIEYNYVWNGAIGVGDILSGTSGVALDGPAPSTMRQVACLPNNMIFKRGDTVLIGSDFSKVGVGVNLTYTASLIIRSVS